MQIFSAVCLLIRENIIWYLLQFSKISLVTFCLGGKILTPVPRRLGVISECWSVANESWGTFWSGQVKYEFRKLSKCVDLIKCSLTFTNEHELTDTQKTSCWADRVCFIVKWIDTMWYQNTERDMVFHTWEKTKRNSPKIYEY